MSEVGSLFWRLKNYGVSRTLSYFLYDKTLKDAFHKNPVNESNVLNFVQLAKVLKLKHESLLKISSLAETFLADAKTEMLTLFPQEKIKAGAFDSDVNLSRLVLIGAVLDSYRPSLFVETGTQHGISAEFATRFVEKQGMTTDVVSIDIEEGTGFSLGTKYEKVRLLCPSGKQLVRLLRSFKPRYDSVVFFHDSDHSFENMTWEFRKALEILDPVAILSDDASLNLAFKKFCNENGVKEHYFREGEGNYCGLFIR